MADDKSPIIQELYNRVESMDPGKAAIVRELARRYGIGDAGVSAGAPDPAAQMRKSALAGTEQSMDVVADAPPAAPAPAKGFFDSLGDSLGNGLQALNPVRIKDAYVAHMNDPYGTATTSKDDVGGILPATQAIQAVQQASEGDIGGAVGTAAAAAIPYALPVALKGAGKLAAKVAPKLAELPGRAVEAAKIKTNLDPTEAASVAYGHENDIPMSTSVQTGSKTAANAENIAQNLPFLSEIAKKARVAEREAIQAQGAKEVANLGKNGAPVDAPVPTALDAGESLQDKALQNEKDHSARANDAYATFRSIEDQPEHKATVQTGTKQVENGIDEQGNPAYKTVPVMQDIQLPVDYRQMKAAVKPLLAETLKPMSIAQEQSSTGIKALRNIMDAPDFVSASTADQDLGALKGIMRESPQSRSVGQAKFAADLLSKQVDAAAMRAGPEAVAALRQGRDATIAKYGAQDFQKSIGFKGVGTGQLEPGSAVDLVNSLTSDGDRKISLLRAVEQHAPDHLPMIAQAKVQSLLEKATAEAGQAKPGTALTEFNKQGPETQRILYGDRAPALKNFFTLQKRIADNPNPSGSGQLIATMKGAGLMLAHPLAAAPVILSARTLSRMLFNPTEARNLIAGFHTAPGSPGAALLSKNIAAAAASHAVPPTQSGLSTSAEKLPPSENAQPGPGNAGRSEPAVSRAGSDAPTSVGTPGGKESRFGTVEIPGKPGGGYKFEYKIKELGDSQASHSGLTFQPNPKSTVPNVRDYSKPVNQGKIVSYSSEKEFEPSYHTGASVDALNGPPLENEAGQVFSGNGRHEMQERVFAAGGNAAKRLRASLAQRASQIEGLNPNDALTMKRPSLRRVISDEEFERHGPNARENLVADTNIPGTAALTPAEQTIQDSRRVSASTLNDIAGRLDKAGDGATVPEALDGKAGGEVLENLIRDGVVAPHQRAAFVDSDTQQLTKAGSERVKQLLIGRFFRDPSHLDTMAPAIANKVLAAAAPLVQVEGKAAWNITPHMQDALSLLEESRKLGIKSVDDFIRQDGLFGKDKYSPETVTIAKMLKDGKQKDFTKAARQYAEDAAYSAKGANTLMGDAPTPAESFAEAFKAPAKPANALAKQ